MKSLKEELKNKLYNQLNEGVPLGPMRTADAFEKVRGPMSFEDRGEVAMERAYRLGQLQKMGEKKATDVIYKLHEKIPGLYDAHLETQLSGNFGDFESPTGAIKDAKRYIKIAKMIANHKNGGLQHAHDYLHGSSMYQLGLGTEFGESGYNEGDPYMTSGIVRTKRGDYVQTGGGDDLAGANIERSDRGNPYAMVTPTARGKQAGDRALRIMSAARRNLRGRS
jgi:hypothetical protein